MMKNEKKCHLKNDKVEHVLLYHIFNDENRTQIVSTGKTKLTVLIFVYTLFFYIRTSKFCLRLAVLNIFSFLRLKYS